MLQAHSFLWNYLWVAPNLFLLSLAFVLWKRGLSLRFPAFTAFAVVTALCDLAVFGADIAPYVSPINFWRIDWANLFVESLLKFIVIGEVFSRVSSAYTSISRMGRILISGIGAALVLGSSLVAAFARGDSTTRMVSGFHVLEQTVFIIELGLILFLILFAAYFRLAWDRVSLGILLGFGVSACVHLATWAVVANAAPSGSQRTGIDFLNMGAFHLSVLIWYYYVLVPAEAPKKSAVDLPENNLAVWNRELERFLQPESQ
jgi:hypothetical protein